MIRLATTQGEHYTLDNDGYVVARTNGPTNWNYDKRWQILGFLKRSHSHHYVPLSQALTGADIGHGYVVDLDHGTRRVWMGSPGRCRYVAQVRDVKMTISNRRNDA